MFDCAGTKCDDGNACTTDTCDKAKGCVFTNNALSCKTSGGSAGVCKAGVCESKVGWQLAGELSAGNKMGYSNFWWTSSTLTDTKDAKKTKYFLAKSNKFRLVVEHLGKTKSIEFNHNLDQSLVQIFTTGTLIKSNLPVTSWRALVTGAGWQNYCNLQGFNVTANVQKARFGLLMNQENDCNSPDTAIGLGLEQGNNSLTVGAGASCNCCQNGGTCANFSVNAKLYVWGANP